MGLWMGIVVSAKYKEPIENITTYKPFSIKELTVDMFNEWPGHLKFSIIAAQWILRIFKTSTVSNGTSIFMTSESSMKDSIWGFPGTQSVNWVRFSGLS